MHDMVLNQTSITSAERFTSVRDSKSKDVITSMLSPSVRSTVSSKRTTAGHDTLPFGYLAEQDERKTQ
jgi:hypothetical protein